MRRSAYEFNTSRFENCGNSSCAMNNLDMSVLMACAVSTFILLGLVLAVSVVAVIICAVIIISVIIVNANKYTEHRPKAAA